MTLPPSPVPVAPGLLRCDVAVVGAGVAGLLAAASLPDGLDVVVVDKGTPGRSGSSPWAQGGLAAALHPQDSPALHVHDTLVAGDGLCDPAAAEVLAHEARDRVVDLLAMGARFDTVPGGDPQALADLHLAREGAQTQPRSVHTADATGAELVRVLRAAAAPRVSRLQGLVVALATHDEGVAGLHVLAGGELLRLEARAVLLATGGCGGLYAATTNQDNATADGVALALHAGAAVRDMEFVQFHPTGLATRGAWRFLLTEALRGAGATLHDRDGRRFMPDVHPDAELAPRHVVARAILEQGDGAFLDATALGAEVLAEEFPTVLAGARDHGFDLATERVPVTPAAHYMVGGVRTDLWARTSLPGLWAAGEVASTGLHGANRMASNSLTEALVFGHRAARSIGTALRDGHLPVGAGPDLAEVAAPAEPLDRIRTRLREALWADAGPSRSPERLRGLLDDLDDLEDAVGRPAADVDVLELHGAAAVGRAITVNALLRDETRGGHVREDAPTARPAWAGVHLERTAPVPRGLGTA